MKKNLIIIFALIILIVIVISVFGLNQVKNSNEDVKNNIDEIKIEKESIEQEISSTFNNCKDIFNKSYDKNFYGYFNLNFIETLMENYKITVINSKEVLLESSDIFDENGKSLESFPISLLGDYDFSNIDLEPDKYLLVKISSNESLIDYYYLIKVSYSGQFEYNFVCCTSKTNYYDDTVEMTYTLQFENTETSE